MLLGTYCMKFFLTLYFLRLMQRSSIYRNESVNYLRRNMVSNYHYDLRIEKMSVGCSI